MMNLNLATYKRIAGLSLIELLIGMLISSLLLVGVSSLYFSSRETDRFTNELSRIQESGRLAIDFLAKDIRMVGYQGCMDPATIAVSIQADFPPTTDFFSTALMGFEVEDNNWVSADVVDGDGVIQVNNGGYYLGQAFVADALIGSDVLTIQGTTSANTEVVQNMAASNEPVLINDNDLDFSSGDIAVIADCQNADMFRITADPNAGGILNLAHDGSANDTDSFTAPYTTDARVMRFESVLYFVADTGRTSEKGAQINALYRATDTMVNAATPVFLIEELIEGIDNMQILYGERIQASGNFRYVPADQVGDMRFVESIKLGLLVSGTLDVLPEPDDASYLLPGETIEPEGTEGAAATFDSDRRLRRDFVTTINLRNRR